MSSNTVYNTAWQTRRESHQERSGRRRGGERKDSRSKDKQNRRFEQKQKRRFEQNHVRGFEQKNVRKFEQRHVRGFEQKHVIGLEQKHIRGSDQKLVRRFDQKKDKRFELQKDMRVHRNKDRKFEEQKYIRLGRRQDSGQKHCHYCRKHFVEKKMYKNHLQYDFSCWKLRKATEVKKSESKNHERKETLYGYESDSGRGSSSDTNNGNEEDADNPQIRMTLSRSDDRHFEVLMASETLRRKESVQQPVVPRNDIDKNIPTNPMVTIKQESWEDMEQETIKHEATIDNTDQVEDIKPRVFVPGKASPIAGIRIVIDRTDMSVVMESEAGQEVFGNKPEDEEIETNVKPTAFNLCQKTEPGIKMTFEKNRSDEDSYALTMASELVQSDIFDKEFEMCRNSECPKIGNHVCAFPAFRETKHNLKTKGVLNIKKSCKKGKSKFVPFNQSFLKTLGCTFYFKTVHSFIEIRSRSLNPKTSNRYKLILYQNDIQTSIIETTGSSKYKTSSAIPINNFEGHFLKYKLIIDKIPRSILMYH